MIFPELGSREGRGSITPTSSFAVAADFLHGENDDLHSRCTREVDDYWDLSIDVGGVERYKVFCEGLHLRGIVHDVGNRRIH